MSFMEDRINKAAVKAIEDIVTGCWEVCDGGPSDHWRRTTLGYIAGIVDMANAAKMACDLTTKEDQP